MSLFNRVCIYMFFTIRIVALYVGGELIWQSEAQAQNTQSSPSSDVSRLDQRVRQYDDLSPDPTESAPLPAARPTDAPLPAAPQTTVLAAVIIEGARTLAPAALAPIYEPFLAQVVTMDDIAAIAERVTQAYRDEGYFLTRAFIPQQSIATGVIRVKVLEGAIVETAVEGSDHRRALVQEHLGRIRAEDPSELGTMERSILLIGDIPGLSVKDARLEEIERASGRFKLTLDLTRDSFSLFSSIDNRGDPDAGRSEIWTSGSVFGLGPVIDRMQVGVFTVPEAPEELVYGEIKLARLIGSHGLELEARLSGSESAPGPDGNETLGTDSESLRATVTMSVPVYRRRDTSYWGRFQLDARLVEDSQDGTPILTDHLRVGRAAIQGSTGVLGGTTWSRLEVSAGTTAFGGSSEGFDRSRADADSSFAKVNLEASHYRDLSETVAVYGYFSGQFADDALLSSEEFGIGGLQIGRGYDYSEISGDDGLGGLLELRYGRSMDATLLESYQVYGFVDAGIVWNRGPFEDERDTLASTGFGLRLSMPRNLNLELEAARPLTRPVNGEGSRPWLGFVTLSVAF